MIAAHTVTCMYASSLATPLARAHRQAHFMPIMGSKPSQRRCLVVRAQGEEPPIIDNPLFSNQFKDVLAQSLARQGADALLKSTVPEGPVTSALEDVLAAALNVSRQNYKMMLVWRDQLERQIASQEKQIDRMEFALSKARQDAAFNKALKTMLYDSCEE